MNRADPALVRLSSSFPSGGNLANSHLLSLRQIEYMQYTIDNTPVHLGEKYVLAKQFGQTLLDNCREMIGQAPLYKDGQSPSSRRRPFLPCD